MSPEDRARINKKLQSDMNEMKKSLYYIQLYKHAESEAERLFRENKQQKARIQELEETLFRIQNRYPSAVRECIYGK
jgi:geranylgeranyl pyrophosphate synthase